MGVPPNEYLNLLQGLNQPMPERNFTPGPGVGPFALPQQIAPVAPMVPEQPVMPMPAIEAPVRPQPFSFGGMEDALLRSAQLQTQAGRELRKVQEKMAQQEQTAIGEQQKAIKEAQDDFRKQQEDYDTKVAPAIDKLQALGQEIQGAEYKSFWAKASTPQKIGAGLALALGALGSAMARTPNFAMDIINKAIDDDYRSWQANLDAKNKSFLNQRQYINDLQGDFKNKQELALAQKALAYDQVNAQLLQIASKRKELEALPAFQTLQANILDNRNRQYLELAKLRAETAKAERESTGAIEGKPENFVPGLGFAYTTKGADELRTLTSDMDAAKSSIARLVEIAQTPGKSISPELRAEADTIRSTLRGQLRTALVGPGQVTEEEQKLLNAVIADPTTIVSLDRVNLTRLNSLQQALDRKIQSAAASTIVGYQKPQQQPVQQAGRITPALQAQAQAQLQAANQRLVQNPNDEQAKLVRDRAMQILGQ